MKGKKLGEEESQKKEQAGRGDPQMQEKG